MNRTFRWSPLWLVVGWSLLVHVPRITSPLLDYHAYRQCQTASMSRNYLRHGMHFFTPELDNYGIPARAGTEFPIYSYLVAILYKIFGLHEIFGRLLSCALAAWSAVFLYRFVLERLGERVALWSALAMCTIPVHIYFTRAFQPESMALWGFLGSVLYLDRYLREGTLGTLTTAILLGALAPLLKLPFMYLVLGVWFLLGWERGRRSFLNPLYWAAPLIIVGFTAAWYHYAKSAPDQILPLTTEEQMQNLAPVLTARFWIDHFISRFPEICTTYSGLLLGGVGAWRLYRQGPAQRFWFGWFFITVIYTALLGAYGHTHKYTEIPWAPINGVFIAVGLVWLWDRFRHSRTWRLALAFLVIGMPLHAALRIGHWYKVERLYLFDARRQLDRVSRPNDLVYTPTPEIPVLLYYVNRYGYAGDIGDLSAAQDLDALLDKVQFILVPTRERWSQYPDWTQQRLRKHRAVLLPQENPDYLLYRLN